jgi:DNA-directed RNA polymerase subunit RPC12/RpoP
MMLQTQPSIFDWFIGVIVLVIFSVSVTYALRVTPKFMKEGSKGRLADWWRWINTPSSQDYKRIVYTPNQTIDRQVVSWSCPICGSDLDRNDVEQMELGYNIKCRYCGGTLGST